MTIRIMAIDPGTQDSAFVLWNGEQIADKGIMHNHAVRDRITYYKRKRIIDMLAVEMVACYGMPVGKETFETCLWVGRFLECLQDDMAYKLCYRKEIKLHLCGSVRAKDANVWQALTDRFGLPGTKKAPGMLYGVKSHERAALAVAVYAHDVANCKPN